MITSVQVDADMTMPPVLRSFRDRNHAYPRSQLAAATSQDGLWGWDPVERWQPSATNAGDVRQKQKRRLQLETAFCFDRDT
jgi:hypothetical protein